MKLCIDCKHCTRRSGPDFVNYWMCLRLGKWSSPVDGTERETLLSCENERVKSELPKCGPDAKYFEPKL